VKCVARCSKQRHIIKLKAVVLTSGFGLKCLDKTKKIHIITGNHMRHSYILIIYWSHVTNFVHGVTKCVKGHVSARSYKFLIMFTLAVILINWFMFHRTY
jgi:hypothetical protein